MAEDNQRRDERNTRRVPRKATARHLENVALWYLQRFAASADSLRRVLMRRVEISARAHDTDRAEGAARVEDIVARFRASGLLDDRVYAEGRARALHRRGLPARAIRMRLIAKGVGREDIESALAALAEETPDPDRAAAVAYARRRRIGPWRPEADRLSSRDRDLAALARKGFDYDTARRIVDAADVEDLEAENQDPGR